MRNIIVVFVLAWASPALADKLPSNAEAVALATTWRTAEIAVPCERSKTDHNLHCQGESMKATMPAPVWFARSGNYEHNDACDAFAANKAMVAADAGDTYDNVAGCLGMVVSTNQDAKLDVKPWKSVQSVVSKAARKKLQTLAKTHRFIRIKLAPHEGDPNSKYDVIVAITADDAGKARVGAVFMRLQQTMDGE